MLDFCLILDPSPELRVIPDLAPLCPIRPERELSYRVAGSPTLDIRAYWAASHPFPDFAERVRIDGAGFRMLTGYPLKDGRPLRHVQDFDVGEAGGYRGDFFYLSVGASGRVSICKSPICSYQLYLSERGGRQVLASRASLAVVAAEGTVCPEPDPDFARWACTYSIGATPACIHQGLRTVLMNQSVGVDDTGIALSRPDPGFLRDPAMADLYRTDPDAYWDAAFEALIATGAALGFSDRGIDFPLSGGKDSRLLLGLILKGPEAGRIERVFTNGPPISPEVRAAKMVCEVLGLGHETVDTTAAVTDRRIEIDDKLALHAHITEAEMSPDSLTWAMGRRDIVQLHGQEGGLRNIAYRDDLATREKLIEWFDIHMGRGDRCGMFLPGVAEATLEDIRTYVDATVAAGVELEDIPSLHRITFRLGRWVARTWRSYNDRWFAPYLFVDTDVIRATFNSGAASRLREEFHYQMLRRIDPRLIAVPFAGQSWPRALAEAEGFAPTAPLDWEDGARERAARPMHEAMVRSFAEVQAFFQIHSGVATDAILDRRKFAALDIATMHPSTYQSLWQLVQIALFESVPDLATLGTGVRATEYGLPSFDY